LESLTWKYARFGTPREYKTHDKTGIEPNWIQNEWIHDKLDSRIAQNWHRNRAATEPDRSCNGMEASMGKSHWKTGEIV
jgi:hypothetical protein